MTRLARRGRATKLAALSLAAITSAATLVAATSVASTAKPDNRPEKPRSVDVQILALNDFHGQLEPSGSSSSGVINGTPAGGAAYLATHLEQLRAEAADRGAHSVTVAAGDLIGATPLVSAAFYDEPTIDALDMLGLDVAAVGNHEFDAGKDELLRKQVGGCLDDGDGANNRDSCPVEGYEFDGADFQYLSANVFHEGTDDTLLPAVEVENFDGAEVAFIGMTLEGTPDIVTRSGVAGLEFADEAETANRLAEELYDRGVKAVVALVHEGGFPADRSAYNSCPGISGPIVDINDRLSDKVDAVITGHTHQAYNCMLDDPAGDPRLVTSAASLGRLVTDINLSVNTRSGEIDRESVSADNRIVTRDVTGDEGVLDLIATYKGLVAEIENKVIGSLGGGLTVLPETYDDSGESALGNLIADAQKADESAYPTADRPTEIALMNPGGIRADLVAEDDGDITYGAAFATQPFNNYVVSMDLTGQQILTLLEQQWGGDSPTILQTSGLNYTWSESAPAGSKVVPGSVEVNGESLDPTRTYRVAANSFLADGGDGFSEFRNATNKYFGGLDIDALAAYLAEHPGYTPVATDRIDVAP